MTIVKVSPKGQITIPKKARDFCDSDQYLFEMKGKMIILSPVVITAVRDDVEGFAGLAEKAFSFWENEKDDVYQEFYKEK